MNTAGALQLTHYYSSSARSVFIDDLALFNSPARGYIDVPYAPIGTPNGKKVYLSPAFQPENIGCDNFYETSHAETLARNVAERLAGFGYEVRVGYGTADEKRKGSNAYVPHVHVPSTRTRTTGEIHRLDK